MGKKHEKNRKDLSEQDEPETSAKLKTPGLALDSIGADPAVRLARDLEPPLAQKLAEFPDHEVWAIRDEDGGCRTERVERRAGFDHTFSQASDFIHEIGRAGINTHKNRQKHAGFVNAIGAWLDLQDPDQPSGTRRAYRLEHKAATPYADLRTLLASQAASPMEIWRVLRGSLGGHLSPEGFMGLMKKVRFRESSDMGVWIGPTGLEEVSASEKTSVFSGKTGSETMLPELITYKGPLSTAWPMMDLELQIALETSKSGITFTALDERESMEKWKIKAAKKLTDSTGIPFYAAPSE